ncbi:MAG: hypothetical protein H7A06_05395 [Pseudomonadales bacterium]|nr:hypothetical protein [Pseudomonadales bacterium]
MTHLHTQVEMLKLVARALGPDLREQMTFVGGCTTGLLVTDQFTRELVRSTDDVDLIVNVMGYSSYISLQKKLGERGFKLCPPSPGEKMPICAMKLGELRVDFMPDDESVLGFSNRWYREAVLTSTDYFLEEELKIRLINPTYFISTKLEAYKGRGFGDVLESRDIEDILNVVDGRSELVDEIKLASEEIRDYIGKEISELLEDQNFGYAIQSHAKGNKAREDLLYNRLETFAGRGH